MRENAKFCFGLPTASVLNRLCLNRWLIDYIDKFFLECSEDENKYDPGDPNSVFYPGNYFQQLCIDAYTN